MRKKFSLAEPFTLPVHPCHFNQACGKNAILSTKEYSPNGEVWNLCETCHSRLHFEKADKWCKDHGLDTTQKKIDYCRKMARTMKLNLGFGAKSRVPGEDDA